MAFILSLVVHESAHAIAGNIFGITRDDLLLLPSGSVGGGVDSIKNFRVKTIVLLAGPFTNLAIAFLLKFFIQPYSAYWNEPANIGVVDPGNFLFQVHLINLSLGVVNLIPVLPTDAGRILRGILSMTFNQQKSERLVTAWTKWVAIACLPLGLYYFNLLLLLFAIYILITMRAESQLESPQQERQPRNPVEPMDFFLNHSHIS
jgi:Zn-dependent protease